VFIDRVLATKHFPLDPDLGNHPGFMLPPNKIFILTDNITPDCGNRQIADDLLTQVLLHEMGHVIEYQLLGGRQSPIDRERSEGFAVWFEQYSSDFASDLPKGQVRGYYRELLSSVGANKITAGGFVADPVGYAKAGLKIETVVSRKGITGLMSVYDLIREQGLSYETAVEKAFSWSPTTFSRHVAECCRR